METQTIQIGDFSLVYHEGFIRYISFGDTELVRKVYFALRDKNWDTAEFIRIDERQDVSSSSLSIDYRAISRFGQVDVVRWTVKVTGHESGRFEFSIDGTVVHPYWRNRVGLCVLHPIAECVGQLAEVTQPDGTKYHRSFPDLIAPHQPFLEIQSFNWKMPNGVRASLHYEGDIFEMEDQRNWSDTSFKTYSTPLRIPFPVELKPGDRIFQKVTLTVDTAEITTRSPHSAVIDIDIDETRKFPIPKLGVDFPGRSTDDQSAIERLKQLQFAHLRIELRLSSKGWNEKLEQAVFETSALRVPLFVHLVFGSACDREWESFAMAVGPHINIISQVALSPSDRKADVDRLLTSILAKARALFPGVAIGAGFVSYFTELNRNRFDVHGLDYLTYSVNPQVHATDTLTVIENLLAQSDAVRSARAIAGQAQIHVGPVSLRPRFNPDAVGDGPDGRSGTLPPRFDVRQTSAMAAGWSLASFKYLTEAGADRVTMFETHGMGGYLLAHDDERHRAFGFEGTVFPLYETWHAFRSRNPVFALKSRSSNPLRVSSFVVGNEATVVLYLINHQDQENVVRVDGIESKLQPYEIKVLPITLKK